MESSLDVQSQQKRAVWGKKLGPEEMASLSTWAPQARWSAPRWPIKVKPSPGTK